MSDLVGIDAAAKTIADALDRVVPKIGAIVDTWLKMTTTLATTTSDAIGLTLDGAVNNFFEKLTLLSNQYKLPVVITISKPTKE